MLPTISIITPSLNQAQYLEQTIDSVLSQNYTALQYIIIDGGSSDGSHEIIKKYQKHLAYWVSEKDRGQSHAINKGLQLATGDVVNWLNSDDYYQPTALSTVAEVFEDISVNVFCGRSNIVRAGKTLRKSNGTDVYADNLPKTIGWARIDQPETFFRREAFTTVGPLNESLKYVMDKEWWIRYLIHFGLKGIVSNSEAIVNFRLHENSKTMSQSEGFEIETNQIYFDLATQSGNVDFAAIIDDIFGVSLTNICSFADDIQLTDALRYFLLRKADEAYSKLDFSKAIKILKKIKSTDFQKAEKSLYTKLAFRTKFPEWLIKLART
jgi:glycosyltransferase involved in cell wall biosynthesis